MRQCGRGEVGRKLKCLRLFWGKDVALLFLQLLLRCLLRLLGKPNENCRTANATAKYYISLIKWLRQRDKLLFICGNLRT